MEVWKEVTDLFNVSTFEFLVFQTEVTADNRLWICLFVYDGVSDYEITIDFGQVVFYEVLQELLLEPRMLLGRSGFDLLHHFLYEIFNSSLLQKLENTGGPSYHHYFIVGTAYYLECVTTGIVRVDLKKFDRESS